LSFLQIFKKREKIKMSPDFCPGSFILLFEFLPGVEYSLDAIANGHGYKESNSTANGGLSATDRVTTNGIPTGASSGVWLSKHTQRRNSKSSSNDYLNDSFFHIDIF
jgi:hypothetical protein